MKTHILRALSEKSFLNLWVGEVITQISGNLFNFFLILIVFKLTHSNTAVSGVVLSFIVPAILFGSMAGVFVDRWDKKKVLIVTNLLRAGLLILLAFYINNLILIYIISLLFSVLTQFFIPAESPMVPLTVKKENLLSANALFGMGIFGSILIPYILSGPLIKLVGAANTLFILGASLTLSAALISFVKVKFAKQLSIARSINRFNFISEIKSAFSLILKTKEISHSLFLLALSQIIVLVLATIAPGYASQVLRISIEDFPLVFITPAAIGMVTGAVILVNFFHSHPKQKLITSGIILSGLAMLLLPYGSKVASKEFVTDLNVYLPHIFDITILHIMAVIAFVLGFANSLVFVPANTIIQEKTTDAVRGKIYGFINSIVGILSLLPVILVGGLSDLIGVSYVIVGIGICLLLVGFSRFFIK